MTRIPTTPDTSAFDGLLSTWDWEALAASLEQHGYAVTPPVLSRTDVEPLVRLYDEPDVWRSRIDMERYRFGRGEYKYFAYPLPEIVAQLRAAFYARLMPIANAWSEQLGVADRFPERLEKYVEQCHAAGQTRPTPLLLRYQAGGYNCLHQDIYGQHAFPLQVAVALSRPDEEYTGGQFLIVENVPRAQSRGTAITVPQGHAVIWATRYRPERGRRGYYRVTVRHGASLIHSGRRDVLGLIFHDGT
jgi:uncharacterized protein